MGITRVVLVERGRRCGGLAVAIVSSAKKELDTGDLRWDLGGGEKNRGGDAELKSKGKGRGRNGGG